MELGSKEWWIVVQTSPLIQAELMLRDYKSVIINDKIGTIDTPAAQNLLSKVNAEIHLISQKQHRSSIRMAMKNILTPEQYEAVIAEQVRLESLEIQSL